MEALLDVPSIQEINLQRTDVTDAGLKTLLAIENLKRFKLVRCKISDEGLALLKDRTDIVLLDLKECINISFWHDDIS